MGPVSYRACGCLAAAAIAGAQEALLLAEVAMHVSVCR